MHNRECLVPFAIHLSTLAWYMLQSGLRSHLKKMTLTASADKTGALFLKSHRIDYNLAAMKQLKSRW